MKTAGLLALLALVASIPASRPARPVDEGLAVIFEAIPPKIRPADGRWTRAHINAAHHWLNDNMKGKPATVRGSFQKEPGDMGALKVSDFTAAGLAFRPYAVACQFDGQVPDSRAEATVTGELSFISLTLRPDGSATCAVSLKRCELR